MQIALAAKNEEQFETWRSELEEQLSGLLEIVLLRVEDLDDEQKALIFCAPSRSDVKPSPGRVLTLVVDRDAQDIPDALASGEVDDLIAAPFNRFELLSRVIHFERAIALQEVTALDQGVRNVIGLLEQDLGLAERLQRSRLPKKFGDLRGIKVHSRYVAGERSGGDYFDVMENEEGTGLSLLLSDSSSYGLSSSVLALLMRMTAQLARSLSSGCRETLNRVMPEVRAILGPKDHLSVFLGTLSRKDLIFKYISLGAIQGWILREGRVVEFLRPHGGPMDRARLSIQETDASVKLEPGDRLIVSSDGFLEVSGGADAIRGVLEAKAVRSPDELLNELAFLAKRRLEGDELPVQDCSCLVVDVDTRAMRMV